MHDLAFGRWAECQFVFIYHCSYAYACVRMKNIFLYVYIYMHMYIDIRIFVHLWIYTNISIVGIVVPKTPPSGAQGTTRGCGKHLEGEAAIARLPGAE